jgi:hypothetical protein
MRQMNDLLELITKWSADMQKLETDQLVELIRLGGRVVRLLELKNRLPFVGSRRSKASAGREPGDRVSPVEALEGGEQEQEA